VLGLPGNATLSRLVEVVADDVRVRRAEVQAVAVRHYTEICYATRVRVAFAAACPDIAVSFQPARP